MEMRRNDCSHKTSEELAPTVERNLSEAQLVRKLRAGDEEAYAQFYLKYQSRLHRSASGFLRNAHDAEDAVQDALIRAFRKIHTFDARSSFYTWLTSILVNCCLIKLRSSARHPMLSLDETSSADGVWADLLPSKSEDIDEAVILDEQLAALEKAIESLRPDFRFILTERNQENRPFTEIASELGLSLPATKSRALRARKLCARNVRLLLMSARVSRAVRPAAVTTAAGRTA